MNPKDKDQIIKDILEEDAKVTAYLEKTILELQEAQDNLNTQEYDIQNI